MKSDSPPHLRARRPLVGSRSPAGIGNEIRGGCQFIRSLFRSLGHLPGGLDRFLPCQPSAHGNRRNVVRVSRRMGQLLLQKKQLSVSEM